MTPSSKYSRAIVMLADGARADVMESLISDGRLPNISSRIVGAGASLRAVTSFPSTTGPAYLPFLTGCFPGTCNIPGIRWFDKSIYDGPYSFNKYRSYVGLESFCMASDMWPHIKTVFEIIPDSYSIFNPIARGARGKRNFTRISRIWYWYYAHLTDRWGFIDKSATVKLKEVLERNPKFIFSVFPAIDEYSHLTHPHSELVIQQYENLDRHVGSIFESLDDRGEADSTLFMIVSDHGLSKTDSHFCVNTFLEKHHLPAFFYPLIFEKRGKLSANMVSGNGMTNIYFKRGDKWKPRVFAQDLEKIAPGIIDDLLAQRAVDIVACRNAEGGADIFSRRGRASVRLDGFVLHYEVQGSDPFGYSGLSSNMSPDETLAATINSEYPDAPFQIAHLMTSPRAGDMVISATPGFDLRLKYEEPEHFASHGSLHKTHMRIPVLCNASLDPKPVRSADVFPTVLSALGLEKPSYIDGREIPFFGR
ncbi:MAG TPA: alkaline phosphatase family protein [bacterium]|nr:alkaline phosphatase family protein [Myxococcales bacterium]OQA61665.1 MAG: Type I phosphodiesterase / nucleotide pyrophosphatase [bacterium ADurb.Bin270]HPW45501.1 alkaline phosphatase family protein [bacterium]HQC50287.1 alkaline phosphatase family protein [bacterium]HQG13076.1 alkaline phosphatase family protein [bacterium]